MEKSFYKRLLLLAITLMVTSVETFAQDFSAVNEDGKTLCYNIIYDEDDQPTNTVELANGGKIVTYSGEINVPATVVNPNDEQTYTVVGIGENAVYNCDNVTSVTLPSTITYIDYQGFFDCDYLESITLNEGLKYIGDYAFVWCAFTQIVLPSTLEYIGNEAFRSCWSLKTIISKANIPPTLYGMIFTEDTYNYGKLLVPETALNAYRQAVGWGITGENSYYCFYNIGTFEEGQTIFGFTDGDYTFDVVSESNHTAVVSGAAEYYFYGDIELPETAICLTDDDDEITFNVVGIGGGVFNSNNSNNLTSIDIPTCYTQYGLFAFDYCPNLKRIIVHNPTPVTLEYPICDTYRVGPNTTLYVPQGSLEAYQNAPFWGYVASSNGGEIIDDPIKIAADTKDDLDRKQMLEQQGKLRESRTKAYLSKNPRRKEKGDDLSEEPINAGYGFMNIREFEEGQIYEFEDEGIQYNVVSWSGKTVEVAPSSSNNYYYDYNKTPELKQTTAGPRKEPWGYVDYSGDLVIPSKATYVPGSENGGGGGTVGPAPKSPRRKEITEPIEFTVTGIAANTFSNNYNINSIELPATINSIGQMAFYECGNLQRIVVNNPTPVELNAPIVDYWQTGPNAVLYVPQGSLELYRNADFWGRNGDLSGGGGGEIIPVDPKSPRKANDYEDEDPYYFQNIREFVEGQIFDFTLDGFVYEVVDYANGEAILTGYVDELPSDIVIPENPIYENKEFTVVGIGDGVFNWCSSVNTIQLPSTIRTIGCNAFYNCQSLTSLNLPDGIYSIGEYAFYYCQNLTNINLGNSLTAIEPYTFYNSGITSVNIPGTVRYIGNNAFYQCPSLQNVTIEAGVDSIANYAFQSCTLLASVTIGEGVRTMGEYVFNGCSALNSITLPSTITTIGQYTFYNCSSLTGVTLPEQLTGIPTYLFYNCSNLKTLTMGDMVTSVGSYAFSGTALETVRLSGGLTEVPDYMFNNVSTLKSVEMGSGVNRIGHYAFSGCSSLETFILPSTIKTLGNYAFQSCSKITEINLSGVVNFGEKVFNGCSGLKRITLSEDLDTIPASLFYYTGLEEVTLPEGIKAIGQEAFASCNSLKTVTLPSTLTLLDTSAFSSCSALTTVNGGSGLKTIGNSAFSSCSKLESFTLPEGLDSIGYQAFYSCQKLNPRIPSTLTKLGAYAFYQTAITSENAVLPSSITIIPDYTFCGCQSLTAFVIPEQVDSIGSSAFRTSGLQSITIPATVTKMGTYIFAYSSITSAILEEGITRIPNYTFAYITTLTSIKLPSSLQNIGGRAFFRCSALQKINLPEGLQSIEAYTFSETGLTEAILPNSLNTMGNDAFNSCNSLAKITLSTNLTTLPSNAFKYCSALSFILIPDNIQDIGSEAFENCTALTDIIFPETLNSIGSWAFSGCTSLKAMSLPEGLYTLPASLFSGCSSLTKVTLPSTVESINYNCFNNCSKLTKIFIKATTPPTSSSSSSWTHSVTATVYVPTGCVEAYQAVFPWNKTNYTIMEWVDEGIIIAEEDWQILKTIYDKANSDIVAMKWSLGESPEEVSNLIGIELDNNGHVTEIRLAASNVEQDILPYILMLPNIAIIDISSNQIGCKLDDLLEEGQVLNVQKASVTSLNIGGNCYEGNIGTFAQMLPNLTVIKAKNNRISDINPLFNTKVTTREVRGQDLDITLNFKELAQKKGSYRYDVMPRILSYSDQSNSLTSNTTWFRLYGDEDMGQPNWLMTFSKSYSAGISIQEYGVNTFYKGESGVEIEARAVTSSSLSSYTANDWHKFKIIMEFDEGDINYSGTTDVSDVQSAINVSVFSEFSPYNYCYNLTAGDLMKDDEVNVIDVVRLINLILDSDNTANNAPPRKVSTIDSGEEDAEVPDVYLYIDNGQLMMQSEKTVGAIDLTFAATNLQSAQWMPYNNSYGATTREKNGRTRAIVCAMNGDSISAGTTIVADFSHTESSNPTILCALASDAEGNPLFVAIGSNKADGIDTLQTAIENTDNIYDLSGRKIANQNTKHSMSKGLYIVNGKKQLIK